MAMAIQIIKIFQQFQFIHGSTFTYNSAGRLNVRNEMYGSERHGQKDMKDRQKRERPIDRQTHSRNYDIDYEQIALQLI